MSIRVRIWVREANVVFWRSRNETIVRVARVGDKVTVFSKSEKIKLLFQNSYCFDSIKKPFMTRKLPFLVRRLPLFFYSDKNGNFERYKVTVFRS